MDIELVYSIDVTLRDEAAVLARFRKDRHVQRTPDTAYRLPVKAPAGWSGPRPVVVGTGPCGLFAGLILAQMGFRPIILDRGKEVKQRTKDTWGLWRRSELNPESNVQFGEGGAGTFSDGKLYSRIKDPRHLDRKVLIEFVKAGAPPEILTEGTPAYRHLPAGRDGAEPARDDRGAGRRIPLRAARRSGRHRDGGGRHAPGAGPAPAHRRLSRGGSGRACGRPQRARHLPHAP